jgi:hypothetical protein
MTPSEDPASDAVVHQFTVHRGMAAAVVIEACNRVVIKACNW